MERHVQFQIIGMLGALVVVFSIHSEQGHARLARVRYFEYRNQNDYQIKRADMLLSCTSIYSDWGFQVFVCPSGMEVVQEMKIYPQHQFSYTMYNTKPDIDLDAYLIDVYWRQWLHNTPRNYNNRFAICSNGSSTID